MVPISGDLGRTVLVPPGLPVFSQSPNCVGLVLQFEESLETPCYTFWRDWFPRIAEDQAGLYFDASGFDRMEDGCEPIQELFVPNERPDRLCLVRESGPGPCFQATFSISNASQTLNRYREVRYLGKQGETVRFSYRVRNATWAWSEPVEFERDLSQGDVVRFRGAAIKVLGFEGEDMWVELLQLMDLEPRCRQQAGCAR
jgi:hypothetical protein